MDPQDEAGLLDPSRDLLRLLDDDDDDDEEPSAPAVAPASAPASAPPVAVEAPAAPVVEAAKEAEEAKPPALAVLGLVGRRPKEVLEEIYLCQIGAPNLDLGHVQCFYQPEDQMLFLCLDLAMPLETHQEEDWAFLLKAGKMEVSKLEALLLLFSLCHVVNWFCNGRAPRLDSDALRLLVKVQEFQVHCALEHRSKTNAAPLVIFVHRELEMPFSPAVPGHQVYDAVEKVLDNRWRNSLKKMKLLQDAKRSLAGLFRVHRPCAVAMGRQARTGDLAQRWVEEPQTALDRLRDRLAEASKEKREKLSFEDWLGTASALHLRLHATLTAAARLPEELAQAVGEPTTGPTGPRELCWALGSWAFPEPLLSSHPSHSCRRPSMRPVRASAPSWGAPTLKSSWRLQSSRCCRRPIRPWAPVPGRWHGSTANG
ncbi:unnamed protein product [Durusdinium trenchii]|uniref:Protein SMG8 n=1 Tax=Durusdinium trenchii TaxID=1381693 RepID=A0ABP0R006_9DINO